MVPKGEGFKVKFSMCDCELPENYLQNNIQRKNELILKIIIQ